jgi:hypothetical protein
MFRKAIWIGLALSVLGFASVSAGQGNFDKKTVLTFDQPVEVPGHVLPAGTYTFVLATPFGDRHVVEIRSADGSKVIAAVAAIPNYRLRSTDKTVIRFREQPSGAPEAIRAWFYPGDNYGQEFVYPKRRAVVLAKVTNEPLPALAADVATPEELKTVPIIAVTPDEKEVPVTEAIQTTPPAATTPPAVTTPPAATTPMALETRHELPKTASPLPLIVLVGLGSLAVAFGLFAVGKRVRAAV